MGRPEFGDIESTRLDTLAHYGVRGMRWGKHKSSAGASGNLIPRTEHPDSAKATKQLARAKSSKGRSLSNKELEQLLNRLNLEKRLSDLSPVRDTGIQKMVRRMLGNSQINAERQAQNILDTKMNDVLTGLTKLRRAS